MLKYGEWKVSEAAPEEVAALERVGFAPLCARVLSARGLGNVIDAMKYLSVAAPLESPFLMKDMKKAADRVRLAIARRERIAVFGDYDVDGITATALLTDFLTVCGGRVTSYIPARLEEGYGLNETAVRQLAKQQVNLIVTVDCGITANAEADLCRKLGMELVVTDHHECKPELPAAVAVVDPHRPDCTYPHKNLSGVGVAFQLASAICGKQELLLEEYADLLCLGLVADVMPLEGEVRTMVIQGLKAMNQRPRPGVAALIRECGCPAGQVTASSVGYLLSPRINAAGRMGRVELALELFLTRDVIRAEELAGQLCRLNRDRQKVEAGIYQEAVSMIPRGEKPAALVLAGEGWHQGVVGIVASRLAEEYACPAFLICMDGDRGKASSRSYGGFNLFAALNQLSPLLESYGGHELAAGFTITRRNVDEFRRRVTKLAAAYAASGAAETALAVDCTVPPSLLTMENVIALSQLEPCGNGFPTPLLCLEDVVVGQLAEVGGGRHLRLQLVCPDGQTLPGIFFGQTLLQSGLAVGDAVDVAFNPQINEYRGLRSIQLNISDVRLCRRLRTQTERERELFERFTARAGLTAAEAGALLPARSEFIAVWRYLIKYSRDNRMQEEFPCLSRKISRAMNLPLSPGRTRICLEVFAEQGLIELSRASRFYTIRITTDGSKVDLNASPIVKALRAAKAVGSGTRDQ